MSNSNKSRLPKFFSQLLKTKREKAKLTKRCNSIKIKMHSTTTSTWMMKNYFNRKQIANSSWPSGSFYTSTTLGPQMWLRNMRGKLSDCWPTKKFSKRSRCLASKNTAKLRNKNRVARTLSQRNPPLGIMSYLIIISEESNKSSNSWAWRSLPFSKFCQSK